MERITDHVARAKARLMNALQGKANVEALLEVATVGLQEIEDVAWQIQDGFDLADAEGEQQNVLGRVLNQDRLGMDDASYSLLLQARQLLNVSSGTTPQILEIFDTILPGTNTAHYVPYYPAAFQLEIDGAVTQDEADLYVAFLRDAVAGGVRGVLIWSSYLPAQSFTFGSLETDTARGFGQATDANTGGRLMGAAE